MATRAVRFSDKEEKAIQDFLSKNPFFDFSTLARMAIINFVEKPVLHLKPTQVGTKKDNKRAQL
jgi:hypothetical protein